MFSLGLYESTVRDKERRWAGRQWINEREGFQVQKFTEQGENWLRLIEGAEGTWREPGWHLPCPLNAKEQRIGWRLRRMQVL